jgi:hypothetical protein
MFHPRNLLATHWRWLSLTVAIVFAGLPSSLLRCGCCGGLQMASCAAIEPAASGSEAPLAGACCRKPAAASAPTVGCCADEGAACSASATSSKCESGSCCCQTKVKWRANLLPAVSQDESVAQISEVLAGYLLPIVPPVERRSDCVLQPPNSICDSATLCRLNCVWLK